MNLGEVVEHLGRRCHNSTAPFVINPLILTDFGSVQGLYARIKEYVI